jgi:hypothetical protein
MRAFLNFMVMVILAVLVVSLVMRGRQTAAVINAITGFFAETYRAILGGVPTEPAAGQRGGRRVVRGRGRASRIDAAGTGRAA